MKILIAVLFFLMISSVAQAESLRVAADVSPAVNSRLRLPETSDEEIDVGYMYWANPRPILANQWYLVIGGTVMETNQTDGNEVHTRPFTSGTISVEKIFFNQPTKNATVSPALKTFRSDLFDGLKKGDKVIVFVNEYDGGYGLIAVPDSNCAMGIKVKNWDEPIVMAIEEMIKKGGAINITPARKNILTNTKYIKSWKKYSNKGIEYLLRDKPYYSVILQEF